jgi:excinuclease ABC subunit C
MMLLSGKRVQLVQQLQEEMVQASDQLRFEDAARLRDRLRAIEKTQERQQAVSHGGGDQDIFAFYREGGFIEAQVLFVRDGKLTGNQAYRVDDFELPDEEVLRALLTQFYQGTRYIPDEILLPLLLEDAIERAEMLSERKGRRVEILRPQRGDRVRLLEMAYANAIQSFREREDGERQYELVGEELRRRLHLRNAPKRIECFDISNIQGRFAVGSMVTFDEGQPETGRYRRFRIKTVDGADDFRMMYEVLQRRYSRAKHEGSYPDLLVVDGGKGQLNVAVEVLRDLEITEVDVVGLAKMRVERAPRAAVVERSEERVFLPGRRNPVVLRRNSNALFLLQRVRDEAHRFAVTYHRLLRGKERLRSALDAIPGVGEERRRRLLKTFGSVKRIRLAPAADLAAVPGISEALAVTILEALNQPTAEKSPPVRRRLRLVPVTEQRRAGADPPESVPGAEPEGKGR